MSKGTGRTWRRSAVKLSEVISLRTTPADRLRACEVAARAGKTEAELAREAWRRGLAIIEAETAA